MKMQANPLTRSTTATRRAQPTRFAHVSQKYERVSFTNDEGVIETTYVPVFTNEAGTKAKGQTYRIGMNAFKRTMRSLGLNRVTVLRSMVKQKLAQMGAEAQPA